MQISAPDAWDETTGSSDVVIAVVDSGLDASHPDLTGRLWTNPGEIAGNGIDDDNNGLLDDIHGWNIVDDDANLSDSTGHGTHTVQPTVSLRWYPEATMTCPSAAPGPQAR